MAVINGLDTNDQSARADLRKQGYYIDNSGVYAPGAGARVGSTFSGGSSSRNEAPSPARLPIVNGTPVSPSNGFTGPQTPAIMYRGDPQFNDFFGPSAPGFSARNPDLGAGPLPAGQATLPKQAPLPATETDTAAAPAGFRSNAGLGRLVTSDNLTLAAQSPETQAAFRAIYGTSAEQAFVQQHEAQIGSGVVDGTPAIQPQVALAATPDRRDEFTQSGIPEGTARTTPAHTATTPAATPATPPAAQSAAAPATTTTSGPVNPVAQGDQAAPGTVTVGLPDGSGVVQVPPEQAEALRSHFAQIADELAKARQFNQGIEQGKLDISRLTEEGTRAYQQALIQGATADRAQALALAQMRADLDKQTIELNKQVAQQNALFQAQQIDVQRTGQAQTASLERERLAVQRQQMRQGRGRRSAVQYR